MHCLQVFGKPPKKAPLLPSRITSVPNPLSYSNVYKARRPTRPTAPARPAPTMAVGAAALPDSLAEELSKPAPVFWELEPEPLPPVAPDESEVLVMVARERVEVLLVELPPEVWLPLMMVPLEMVLPLPLPTTPPVVAGTK